MTDREKKIQMAQEQIEFNRTMIQVISAEGAKGQIPERFYRPREGKEKMESALEQGFITIEWETGFLTIPVCEWKKLPEGKKNKILALAMR